MKTQNVIGKGLAILLVCFALFSCSDSDILDEQTVPVESLPQASRATLNSYFEDATVTQVKKAEAPNIYNSIYSVLLNNGFEIDFDKDGRWTEIESDKDLPIPAAFLQEEVPGIYAYLQENYRDLHVVEIERERYGFSVELNNDVDLIFDQEYNLIGMDLDDDDDDEERIALSELPQAAQSLISATFAEAAAVSIFRERDDNRIEYKVYLNNGIKIEFDQDGNWKEIESTRQQSIPGSLLLNNIASYISTNYGEYRITEVERNSNGSYSIEIEHNTADRDLELEFDAQGNFIRVDD